MADRSTWIPFLLVAFTCLAPAPAAADWYVTPFVGMKFGGSTTLVDFASSEGTKKVAIGGSVALISDGLFGVEADYSFYPGFFQSDRPLLGSVVESSQVQTLTGNVIIAVPLGITRESLRPYVVGGLGWMKASSDDIQSIFTFDNNLVALNLGAGAIGMLGNRAGLRFDVRHYNNLDRDTPTGFSIGLARLSFWRATVGVTFRY